MAGKGANAQTDDWGRAYKARKTVCEMLMDRGFVMDFQDLKQNSDEMKERLQITGKFDTSSRDKLLLIASHRDNPTERIIVFFPADKLGIKTVKEFVETMQKNNIYHAIIVIQNQATSQAKKALEQCAIPLNSSSHNCILRFERFQESELQINITKHVLVPKHEVISEDEKKRGIR